MRRAFKSTNEVFAILKNSLIIHKEKTKEITSMSVVLYLIKNHVNFSFDFLDLDNVYFQKVISLINS